MISSKKKVAVLTKIGHDFYSVEFGALVLEERSQSSLKLDMTSTWFTYADASGSLSQSSLKLDMTSTIGEIVLGCEVVVAVLTKIGHDFYVQKANRKK